MEPFETVDCTDATDFANILFNSPPRDPCTCVFDIDPDSIPKNVSYDEIRFNIYRDVAIEGFRVLFTNAAIGDLSHDNYALFRKYMKSIGTDVYLNVLPESEYPNAIPWKMAIQDQDKKHYLYFVPLKTPQ